ncbi:protoglobin domain-containing protein [Pseudochelatococcus contaminans]|nr:globin-coupled sensor protein [Pseudochelatococcus contaminans]
MNDKHIAICRKKDFLKIGADDSVLMRDIFHIVQNYLADLLDEFYGGAGLHGRLLADFGLTPDQHTIGIAYIKQIQLVHWRKLFLDGFGTGYEESVRDIVQARNRIGLEPSSYIGSYLVLLRSLAAVVGCLYESPRYPMQANETAARIISAASRAIMLDMDLIISTHFDTVRSDSGHQIDNGSDRIRNNAARTIDNLSGIATQVDEIVRFIHNLAGETRILALKASVDAMSAALESPAETTDVAARMAEIRQASNRVVAGIYDTIEDINVLTDSVAISIHDRIEAVADAIRLARQPAEEQSLPTWERARAPVMEAGQSRLGAFVAESARFRR